MPGTMLGRRKQSVSPVKPQVGATSGAGNDGIDSSRKDFMEMDDEYDSYNEAAEAGMSRQTAFPVMGAGSRSKILHQLGEPAGVVAAGQNPFQQARKQSIASSGPPSLSPSYSQTTVSHSNNVSPLSSPTREAATPSRIKAARRISSNGKMSLNLTGLKEIISSSPVSTPTHLSGVLPQDSSSYFSFPSQQAQSQQALLQAPQVASSSSQHSIKPQYASMPLSNGSRSTSSSSLHNVLKASPSKPQQQKSAPPGVQTFKIGLPPVAASPRTTLSGSPSLGGGSPASHSFGTLQPYPSGMVSSRSESFLDFDGGLEVKRAMTTAKWPTVENGKSSDPAADDGPLEEIVPWLYQDENGKRPGSPSTISSYTRSRQPSIQSAMGRPNLGQGLKGSKSTNNMRQQLPRLDSSESIQPAAERERKQSGRFMGMLRKKSSAIAVNLSDVLHTKDKDRSGSNGTLDEEPFRSNSAPSGSKGTKPKMSPRSASTYTSEDTNGRNKKFKKEKKGREPIPAVPTLAPGYPGISLDTNLDEMEGIVDMSTLASGASNPYDHINAVTANINNSPRPGTPPSPAQLIGLRRPSLAGSLRYEFLPGDVPDTSPVIKRLGLQRRDSVDIMASMNKWSANGGIGSSIHQPVAGQSDGSRKGSIVSLGLANDRRGSEGTVNGVNMPDARWQAPDSWAVKTGDGRREDDSDEDDRAEEDTAAMGSLPPTPLLNGDTNGDFANGRAVANRRPTTGGSAFPPTFGGAKQSSHTATIRIFKPDNAHTILNVPFNISVAELVNLIAKKPGFMPTNSKLPAKSYKLYLRARGLERIMSSQEKPLIWQDRKFRSAGYDPEADRLEELGREDNSYLCKFIFRPETLPSFRAEEEGIEGFEYIDLAGRGIENLPIFLYKHAHEIISLNVSRNTRLHLPVDFVQLCSSLRDLKMVEMGMKRVPQSVRQITGLTRLDMSINRIVDLEHCQLDETRELTTLYVHNNRLTSLPDYFVRFQALKYLNISNNRFETFPVVVCEVLSLNDLDISVNQLTSLPPEIGKLKNLERLILLCNNITALPATMGLLTNLRELDVRRNAIQDFTPINSMPALQTLRAQHNMSKALELKVGNLAHLHMASNAITRFTVSAGNGPASLTHLDLSCARLETVPEDLFSLCTSLQLLVLSDNKIRSLSENVGNLTKLARLAINNNALLAIPESIGKLQRLHTFDASNNKLTSLPSSIWTCSELSTLNLSSNNIVEFPDPPQLPAATDDIDESERKASSASAIRVAPSLAMSLKKLYLAYNRLRDEVFRPISLMSGLTSLNLSFNDIYEIPPGMLQKCYQLTSLYLSGNMLTSLPADDLERLINLRVLHMNGNKLQTLPAELGSIKSLQVLDVGSNALKYNIANWPYDWNWNWNLELRYLNLSGNKRLEIKPSAQPHTELSPTGMPVRKRNLSDFSALTKMRVLGLMDVTLMIPSVPDESEDRRVRTSLSSINEMGYGVADSLGASDHLSTIDMVIPRFRGKEDECVIGLFDAGQQDRTGGSRITKFIVDSFVQRLTLELSRLRDEDVSQGLRRTFLSLNRDWGNTVTPDFDRGRKESDALGQGERFQAGTNSSAVKASASALVVYMYKKTLYIANVGSSMAVIAGRTMLARQLSTNHEACCPEEVARIRSAEGWISPRGLVNDLVECARAFGCFHAFPAVNCEPAVHVLDLVDSDEFVIIANKGFWDVMSYQSAVDIAWEHRSDPMLAAQRLRDLAIAYGSESNVVVMVINVGDLFKSKQPRLNRGLTMQTSEKDNFYDTKYVARRVQGSIPGLRITDDAAAPQGTVALVFTDIRNSTALWETNPGMQNAMRIHHELLRRLIRAFDGYEVKTEGDAFMVSFSSVTSAVLWCYTVQMELLRADWPVELIMSEEGKELYGPQGELIYRGLSVRMGLHWGAPICEQDPVNHRMDYLGPMVNRAARVSGVAEGGQITASADAVEVLRAMLSTTNENDEDRDNPLVDPNELDPATKRDIAAIRQLGCGITEIGEHKLKGLETPEFLSLLYPSALAGRLTGGKSKDAIIVGGPAQPSVNTVPGPSAQTQLQPLLESNDVRNLSNICLRLEALSAGASHGLYELPSNTSQSNSNSPTIGFPSSTAAPKRRITLSPHLLTVNLINPGATDEQLLVLVELLVVRIENVLSTLQLRQLGPFTDVLAALGDATKIDPQYILRALQTLSQML